MSNRPEPDTEDLSLLALCEAMHMIATGTVVGAINRAAMRKDLDMLQRRLDTWSPSLKLAERYDSCVRALIIATIQEWEGRL